MNTMCKMRDIYKALSIFETAFEEMYAISLNEAMVPCVLREVRKEIILAATSRRTEMAPSHTSKVIRAIEDRELIRRVLGKVDRRQMYFSLTEAGEKCLDELDLDRVEVPEILKLLMQVCNIRGRHRLH